MSVLGQLEVRLPDQEAAHELEAQLQLVEVPLVDRQSTREAAIAALAREHRGYHHYLLEADRFVELPWSSEPKTSVPFGILPKRSPPKLLRSDAVGLVTSCVNVGP